MRHSFLQFKPLFFIGNLIKKHVCLTKWKPVLEKQWRFSEASTCLVLALAKELLLKEFPSYESKTEPGSKILRFVLEPHDYFLSLILMEKLYVSDL